MATSNPTAFALGQVISYNQNPYISGKGSGILLHAHTLSGHTLGCVAQSPTNLRKIYTWEGGQTTQIQIKQ
ncbi:hypothetical protein JSY14_05180 [Brachybacterium sp. EF45031]|uniref:hypothetical protein n=1 Tax=Brachybacterium sillae TaxID=2810536 RepID=UPI00217D1414|nr:hypothetical protein [Brachybacterium sillae]MCS6711445.1 hypothetical protein [Brachybacterium sillae]